MTISEKKGCMSIMDESINAIKKKIKAVLDKDRYRHTLGVAYTAACMAMNEGSDMEQAYLAGLLHDCAKCMSNEEKYRLCKEKGIELTESELANPSLVHAKLGACLAKDKYGIEDDDIIASIRSHTTGEPDMSLLQKIIYTADYIEPGRDTAPDLASIRQLAFRDLDRAVYVISKATLEFLRDRGGVIDPMTESTYRFYKEKAEKNG